MKIRKALTLLLLIPLFFVGCSPKETKTSGSATEGKVTKVLVGTEGTYSPFNFMDENGELTGYDVEVVQEIDKRIDDYEFDFLPAQWDSLFLGLESGKYDMIADQIVKSAEREEKYAFSKNSYFSAVSQLIVKDDNNTIKTMEDLKGKKVGVSVGTTFAKIFEDYNSKNDNTIDIQYYEGNITSVFQDIEMGRVDATINDKIIALDTIDKLGLKIKIVGEPIEVAPSYFVFTKDSRNKELIDKIDKALDDMKADGSLAEISTKWFKEDFTK